MKRHFTYAVILFLVAIFAGCSGSRQYTGTGSERAPGADFDLLVENHDSGNWIVTVTVSNLTPPARLNPEMTVWVVWFAPREGNPTRAGVLQFNEDERTGRLRATVAHSVFQVIVTAETAPDVGTPSDIVVFRETVESPE
jgi:hypothetical protein